MLIDVMNDFKNFILYTAPNGEIRVDVLLQNESVWLTQKAIADLFGVQRPAITKHLGNIFETGELEEKMVSSILEHTTQHGAIKDKTQKKETKYYNLDAIISVGYRVNSTKATQFRIWATQTLKEYIIKGFVLDDNRLKQGQAVFGKDYFKELLQRVRSIRASERRIYQQVTDIFAECSIDYDSNSEISKNFYAIVQNKFHFAITGKTAAEIIFKTADAKKENMGLTSWKILTFNDYKILEGKGKISKIQADKKAITEYEVFNKTQKIISDFDKQIRNKIRD